ncbi:unnamed protein product [Gongylonema pulchrum]|uniref:SUN domain-containing protein n=1 Tax=Gongylonema pulchrum TaxID=637853 RepID=A0A183DKX7_9BILA|nr:unnamed protein product [Gongylonema pulchrum]
MADDGFRHVEPQLKFFIPPTRKTTAFRTASCAATVQSSTQHGGVQKRSVFSGHRQYSDFKNAANPTLRSSAASQSSSQRSVHFHPEGSAAESGSSRDIFSSAIFHNVKRQLEYSLSDSLRRRANGGIRRATGSLQHATRSLSDATGSFRPQWQRASVPAARSVRLKMNEISSKLSLPKFFVNRLENTENGKLRYHWCLLRANKSLLSG